MRPRISKDLAERIDKLRGDVPRDVWIRRELEKLVDRLLLKR